MFVHALDKKMTLLKILLNPGLNSAIFRGTRPSVKSKEINCAPKSTLHKTEYQPNLHVRPRPISDHLSNTTGCSKRPFLVSDSKFLRVDIFKIFHSLT